MSWKKDLRKKDEVDIARRPTSGKSTDNLSGTEWLRLMATQMAIARKKLPKESLKEVLEELNIDVGRFESEIRAKSKALQEEKRMKESGQEYQPA
tara:strand:+ start:324 stop:608 length:285 start_codon:yes stop_codon:yes gene_type:complete